jgi:hypothetical protein
MKRHSIYKIANDGVPVLVQAEATLEEAKARVRELAKFWPGEYVISEKHESSSTRLLQPSAVLLDS